LIPGLIDAHAHVRGLDDLQDALRFGWPRSSIWPQSVSRLKHCRPSARPLRPRWMSPTCGSRA